MRGVPPIRIKQINDLDIDTEGKYVLYWMNAFRRFSYNFSLQRAVQLADRHRKGLWVVETLTSDYAWACDRFHRAIMDGMRDHTRIAEERGLQYYPYIEERQGQVRELINQLSQEAVCIVTDDFPSKQHRNSIDDAVRDIEVTVEAVDSNGLLPLAAANQVYKTAYSFRRFLQKELTGHLAASPVPDPLIPDVLSREVQLPGQILERWPATPADVLEDSSFLTGLPIDHSIGTVTQGFGPLAAKARLEKFIEQKLHHYGLERNDPTRPMTSGLSGYLHFGQTSSHEIFHQVMAVEDWSPHRISGKATGQRSGWWGVSESTESFLDELITWRELGYNMAWQQDDYDLYRSLPEWARESLGEHALDSRPYRYSFAELESAETHDPLWNASQVQLITEGFIHNYLRMLWGKKILEWSASPEEALENMIELNNRYALDGRNPNSYSGIFWVLGRYDRPWGPERPIFGKIRYMSSENTARKFKVKDYIDRYSGGLLF